MTTSQDHESPVEPSLASSCMVVAFATAIGLVAPSAWADSHASLVTPAGASMILTVQLTITTALGTSSDTDTRTLGVVGTGSAGLVGPDPAWSSCTMDALHLAPSNATFHFDLFCFPFIGCQSLDVAFADLVIDLTAPTSSPIAAGGAANFVNAPVLVQGFYSVTGLATASGPILNPTNATIACRIQPQAGNTVRFDQMSMTPLTTVLDPATLPAGVTAATVTITSNLANTTMSGPWVASNPFDLDGNGSVGASDIAILLNQWGGPGSADFNGNGAVDAADLAALLSNWA